MTEVLISELQDLYNERKKWDSEGFEITVPE